MSIDERVTALEQGLAATRSDFLVHLSESNRQIATLNKVIAAQELNSRDVDHNLTMLLGIATEQGKSIKAVRNDLGLVKERVEQVEVRLDSIDRRMESGFEAVDKRLGGLEDRFEGLERKFDHMLVILSNLADDSGQEI